MFLTIGFTRYSTKTSQSHNQSFQFKVSKAFFCSENLKFNNCSIEFLNKTCPSHKSLKTKSKRISPQSKPNTKCLLSDKIRNKEAAKQKSEAMHKESDLGILLKKMDDAFASKCPPESIESRKSKPTEFRIPPQQLEVKTKRFRFPSSKRRLMMFFFAFGIQNHQQI